MLNRRSPKPRRYSHGFREQQWSRRFGPRSTPMAQRQFLLIVVDRDTGEFTVEGPMSDDRPWNTAVVNAQKVGRNIRCFGMGDLTPEIAAGEWRSSCGGI